MKYVRKRKHGKLRSNLWIVYKGSHVPKNKIGGRIKIGYHRWYKRGLYILAYHIANIPKVLFKNHKIYNSLNVIRYFDEGLIFYVSDKIFV